MFDYICEKCGKVQEPIRTEGDWQIYATSCRECGGSITVTFAKDRSQRKKGEGGGKKK